MQSKFNLSATCQIPVLSHFYEKYFDETGIFVEVGAYDGESFSNTSCLADLGWEGLYIEPHPEFAKKCLQRHHKNNVKVYNYAIDSVPGTKTLHVGDALTTMSDATKSAYNSISWSKHISFDSSIQIQAIRLDSLLNTAGIAKEFDLLVVDVEGYELNVFNSFDIDEWKPKMVIVELNDYHPSFWKNESLIRSSKIIRSLLSLNSYFQLYADHINTIFLHKDHMKA
jgi:FkbM family methyltransferase